VTWSELTAADHGRRATVTTKVPPCGGKGCQGQTLVWVGTIGDLHGQPAIFLDGSEQIGRFMGWDDAVEFEP
jgi:hypothetical protein